MLWEERYSVQINELSRQKAFQKLEPQLGHLVPWGLRPQQFELWSKARQFTRMKLLKSASLSSQLKLLCLLVVQGLFTLYTRDVKKKSGSFKN